MYVAAPAPIPSFETACCQGVAGITFIGEEVFVVCRADATGAETEIQVYNVTACYAYTRSISILITAGDGITACATTGYLYLADQKNGLIYKINSKNSLDRTSWSASLYDSYQPWDSITIDSQCNIITVSGTQIQIFDENGLLVDSVTLSGGLYGEVAAHFAARTSNGYAVVYEDTWSSVVLSLFSSSGDYELETADSSFYLLTATSLIVNNDYIIVADAGAGKVKLFNPSLNVVPGFTFSAGAYHMWLDTTSGILYVGFDYGQNVTMYTISG